MTIFRNRYIAVRDNGTKVLMDKKGSSTYGKTRQQRIDDCWMPLDKIGQARILSWHTENTAKAALKNSFYTENVDYEIIEMTESFTIPSVDTEEYQDQVNWDYMAHMNPYG